MCPVPVPAGQPDNTDTGALFETVVVTFSFRVQQTPFIDYSQCHRIQVVHQRMVTKHSFETSKLIYHVGFGLLIPADVHSERQLFSIELRVVFPIGSFPTG